MSTGLFFIIFTLFVLLHEFLEKKKHFFLDWFFYKINDLISVRILLQIFHPNISHVSYIIELEEKKNFGNLIIT